MEKNWRLKQLSKKISELPSAESLTGTEEIPIVQTGTTKKATVQKLNQAEILLFGNSSLWTNPSSGAYNPISIEQKNQLGSNFSVANNKITCLNDVTFLYNLNVSLQQGSTGSNKFFRLRKNGNTDMFTMLQNSTSTVVGLSISSILVEAQAGDYFEVCYYGVNTDKIDQQRLFGSFIKVIPSGS